MPINENNTVENMNKTGYKSYPDDSIPPEQGYYLQNPEDTRNLNYELLLVKMKSEADGAVHKKCTCSGGSSHDQTTNSTSGDDPSPDGGWGWMVCLGSFWVNFILDGTMFSFGIILLDLLEEFGETKANTAWIGSVLLGNSMILGPFVGWLLDRYSLRQVTISGALLATSGFVSSVFAPNIAVLTFTYGFVGGIGFCMMFLPAILAVGLYFSRKRAIATGIAMSGSGLGTFAYAYVCEALLSTFDWRGTILILAGLVLNCAVCGALFRPLRKRDSVPENANTPNKFSKCCDCVGNVTPESPCSEKQLFLKRDDIQVERDLYNSTSVLDRNLLRPKHFSFRPDRREYCSDMNLSNRLRPKLHYDVSNPLARKDIYYSGSVNNLHLARIEIDESSSDLESCSSQSSEETRRCCVNLKPKTVDCKLFRNVKFLLLLSCMTLWTAQSVTMTYLPDMSLAHGVSRDQSALLISICGMTNTLGRIGAGLATDFCRISSTCIYICALFVGSAVNFAFPFCTSFPTFASCSGLFGLCMASAVSLRTIVIAEHLGMGRLTSAFSMVAFFQGIAFILNPPVAGFVYDLTGSYIHPFFLTGSMYLLSAISCLPLLCMPKRRREEVEIVISSEQSSDESLVKGTDEED